MGIFTTPSNRFYVPPVGRHGRSPHGTLLGGPPPAPPTWYDDDPNVVRVSGGNGRAPDSNVQVAQQPPSAPAAVPSDDYYLKFDGRYLKLFKGDEVVKEWPGVAGRENFGSSRNQHVRDYGPLPEGTYDVKQGRHQVMDPVRRLLGGLGEWPGGIESWGTERVWLDPTKETAANGLMLKKGRVHHPRR